MPGINIQNEICLPIPIIFGENVISTIDNDQNCQAKLKCAIFATDTDGVGWLGQKTWFNPPKPGLQFMALCGTVYTLSTANNTLLNFTLLAC